MVSDACYPETFASGVPHDRAWRASLAREGHRVTLLIPNRQVFRDDPLQADGLRVIFADGTVEGRGGSAVARRNKSIRRFIPKFAQRWILYFYCHEFFAKYNPGIFRQLVTLDEPFDAVLSISYPAAIHRAVSRAMRRNPNLGHAVTIAEFSDPPFRGDVAPNVFPAYYLILKCWGRRFDYFTIPVEKALDCYTPYKSRERIKIIPQGFDLTAVKRRPYEPNPRPTFAYAGRFYERIRDPRFLFDFLETLDADFRFDLYINYLDPCFAEMIRQAQQRVRGRIVLREALPRERLIERLGAADFLINFDNTTSNATPSKADRLCDDRPADPVVQRPHVRSGRVPRGASRRLPRAGAGNRPVAVRYPERGGAVYRSDRCRETKGIGAFRPFFGAALAAEIDVIPIRDLRVYDLF